MLAIFVNTSYDFIGKRRWAYAVSVAVMLLGLASIFLKDGLQYDIDFTGGALVELRLVKPTSDRGNPLAPDGRGTGRQRHPNL
jgi:preprotein translocase subunit SecF